MALSSDKVGEGLAFCDVLRRNAPRPRGLDQTKRSPGDLGQGPERLQDAMASWRAVKCAGRSN